MNLTSRLHHHNTKPLASFFSLSTYAGLNQGSICRYEDNLTFAKKVATLKGLTMGTSFGLFWMIAYTAVAATFYFGVILIQNEGLRPGNIQVESDNLLFISYSFVCLASLLCRLIVLLFFSSSY